MKLKLTAKQTKGFNFEEVKLAHPERKKEEVGDKIRKNWVERGPSRCHNNPQLIDQSERAH